MQVVYNKLWLAELHNIVDSLKIVLQPKRKWRRLVHYILNGIILRAKCCILFQISMTYDSKVQMTKCLRWFCLWFVFLTGDMLFLESTRMTTQLKKHVYIYHRQFKNTCHQASVIISPVSEGSGDVMVLRRSRPPPAARHPPPAARHPPPAARRPQWC